jgi:sugar lactone lactonase YvrE
LYNRYLVSNWGNGNIIQIDSVGVQSYFSTLGDHVAGLHILGNTLYAASNEGLHAGLIGYDLETADTLVVLKIPGMQLLNDVTSDTSGYLYVTEYYGNKIYKIRVSDYNYSTFVNSGLSMPNGILFDEHNNRLLVISEGSPGSPIKSVSLEDSTTSVVVLTGLSSTDGLAEDSERNIYISSWATNSVYRYDVTFTNPRELFSSGHSAPADIFINKHDNILAVPNFYRNTVDLVPLVSSSIGEQVNRVPRQFDLYQNYPNPFNPVSTIRYTLPEEMRVVLRIYDIRGKEIRTLVNEHQKAGFKSVVWDGRDDTGRPVGSGIYIYRIQSDDPYFLSQSRKMLLTM